MTSCSDKTAEQVAVAAGRYAALRLARPSLFTGDGAIRIDDRIPGVCEGVVHANPWFMVVADPVTMPDGRRGTYARIVPTAKASPVAVLPIDADGCILMLDHWRHATQARHLEIPRGFGEHGVEPTAQAAAELREEMGVEACFEPLGVIHPDTGLQASSVSLFLARIDAGQTPVHREGLAEIVRLTPELFCAAVLDGRVEDPFAIAAWTRLMLRDAAKPHITTRKTS